MRKFIVAITLLLFSVVALAESGFYYNAARDGEGIFVTIDKENRISWALFTYWDNTFNEGPVVSPRPPPSTIQAHAKENHPFFVTGAGVYVDNFAIGRVYYSIADKYPEKKNFSVATQHDIGTFLIEAMKDGFVLAIDCNTLMPHRAYMCTELYFFTDKLIGQD